MYMYFLGFSQEATTYLVRGRPIPVLCLDVASCIESNSGTYVSSSSLQAVLVSYVREPTARIASIEYTIQVRNIWPKPKPRAIKCAHVCDVWTHRAFLRHYGFSLFPWPSPRLQDTNQIMIALPTTRFILWFVGESTKRCGDAHWLTRKFHVLRSLGLAGTSI